MDLTLNGRAVSPAVREGATLLEALREGCGVTSVKDGCAPEGSCGACTVMVEGKAVVSCAQPASRFEGRAVTTQEGLSVEDRQRWAASFVAAGASQCGFCSPGIVMKCEALLGKNAEPSRDEVARALAGNLCRCTGYVKIIDAVELAAASRRGEPLPKIDRSGRVGTRTARYQGEELALGDKPYVNDMTLPGMLHGAVRWSDHPRARILRIDTSRAEAHPGVVRVATWRDVPGQRVQGLITKDWRLFVGEGENTAYVGDVLAVVVADSRATAREAAALVDVEYEVLDPVTHPRRALDADAPLLHENGNVLSHSSIARGDVDAALATAAHVATETFRTQFIEHAFLEPESSLAVPIDGGGVHFYSQGQGVWDDRVQVASFLDLPEEKVRATQVANGGAFGAKEDLNVQPHASLLALLTGAPGPHHAVTRGEHPASIRSATRSRWSTRPGATRTATWSPCGRTWSGTRAPMPAWATRCWSARPATPAAPTGSPTSTSRRAPSTRTTHPRVRCAGSAPTRRTSGSKGSWTSWPRRSVSTGGRCAGGTPSTWATCSARGRSSDRASG